MEIECEGPDEGELVIPGSFLDALANCEGCWGQGECGLHKLLRYHAVEADADDGTLVQLRGVLETPFSFYPGRDW